MVAARAICRTNSLPGMPVGTLCLGGGGPYSAVGGKGFNFSGLSGEYFTVCLFLNPQQLALGRFGWTRDAGPTPAAGNNLSVFSKPRKLRSFLVHL